MTSKNLFFKLIKQDFKKRIWCPILIFIGLFLVLEVQLLMEMENILRYPNTFDYDIVTFVKDIFFGKSLAFMSGIACIAAFLCGISGYAYLHSRSQLDLYHSLPVSRTYIFWSKYLSGILQFFIPLVIHVLICAGIAAGRNAFVPGTIPAMIAYVGVVMICFVLTYSVTVVAVGLTGNIIVSILGAGVLFGYSAIIAVLTYVLYDKFFHTYATFCSRIVGMFNDKIWCFSPSSMILKLYTSPNNRTMEAAEKLYKYDVSYVWVLIVAAVVYSLAAYIIYLKRPSEAAGKSIAFCVAEPVIKTLVVVPAAFFFGIFFSELAYTTTSEQWFLFGLIFGFVILCILMEIIFRQDIHGALMHKKQFLFNAVCTALIFVVLKYDVIGYDTYVPSDSQIQSCAVSIEQLMPLSQSIRLNSFGIHYIGSDDYRMANMEIQENPSVMELARKAAKEKIAYRIFDYYEGIEEDPEYIETLNRQENYRNVAFGYKLRNGQTIYRKYIVDIADADTRRLIADIFNDYDYKLGSTPVFNNSWNVTFDVLKCENNFKSADITLTPDMQSRLMEAYQKEYTKLTMDTVMNVIPAGTMNFMVKDGKDSRNYLSYSGEMYVYPEFVETLELLRSYGFDMEERLTADEVESIRVTKIQVDSGASTYYMRHGISSFSYLSSEDTTEDNTAEYTDKEQIQQILDSVVNSGFSWDIGKYADYFDAQYGITIVTDIEDSSDRGCYFIKEQIPDFIKISAKNN